MRHITLLPTRTRSFGSITVTTAMVMSLVVGLSIIPGIARAARYEANVTWREQNSGVSTELRGLSSVNSRVAWASGAGGTVLRTVDGGGTWRSVGPPDTAGLDFRDIEAFDADTAVVLSIGNGTASRVYRTTDGGRNWTRTFTNPEETAFYDCMSFSGRDRGLAVSDPVNGRYRLIGTEDGGRSWAVLPTEHMPEALPGEAAFAASGQCLVTRGEHVWLVTGGATRSRVFHSPDWGRHWEVNDTPLAASASSGVFAVAFRDSRTGLAIGGDHQRPTATEPRLAATFDRGRSWESTASAPPGYRSGLAWIPGRREWVIAVGITGSDLSVDSGDTWTGFDTTALNTIDCARGSCWAAGPKGRLVRLGVRDG